MQEKRIVIVDDDPDVLATSKVTLESAGYQVSTASERAEGLKMIRSIHPDLIVLDVMMDNWQDGFTMARELREDQEFARLPIIIMSAVKDKTGVDFKSAAGDPTWLPVQVFLDKPVEPTLLLNEVTRLLAEAENKNVS